MTEHGAVAEVDSVAVGSAGADGVHQEAEGREGSAVGVDREVLAVGQEGQAASAAEGEVLREEGVEGTRSICCAMRRVLRNRQRSWPASATTASNHGATTIDERCHGRCLERAYFYRVLAMALGAKSWLYKSGNAFSEIVNEAQWITIYSISFSIPATYLAFDYVKSIKTVASGTLPTPLSFEDSHRTNVLISSLTNFNLRLPDLNIPLAFQGEPWYLKFRTREQPSVAES